MQITNLRQSLGDRFISQRGLGEDAAAKFNLKVELFSCNITQEQAEERKNNNQVNSS